MHTVIRRCSHVQPASGLVVDEWLLSHFHPTAAVTPAHSSSRHQLITSASASYVPIRSLHLSSAQQARLSSYPAGDGSRAPRALLGRAASPRKRRPPHVVSRPIIPSTELRTLNEAAVRERRRRLAARHKELSFLPKAPLLASALPPSLANTAPALPRTDFSYAWPSLTFHRVTPSQQPHSAQQQPAAYESARQEQSHVKGVYERQLRERKADKNKAIAALKQRINALTSQAGTSQHDSQPAYDDCLEAVKLTRQLYSPLLTPTDYYTLIVAAGLCMHERLLARLLEDAGIAGVRLPSELFARLLQQLAAVEQPVAVRCVVVVVHEFFRQLHVRGSESNRGDWQSLPLSAEHYGRVLLIVSRMSSTHLLLPLLQAFHHSSSKAREDIPLVCNTILPALRYLSHHQQYDTLLSLSSAVLRWEVASSDEMSEIWSGQPLSDVSELLQLHFDALQCTEVADEASQPLQQPTPSPSPFAHSSSGLPLPVSVEVPDSWLEHLPPMAELCAMVPSLHLQRTAQQWLEQESSREEGGEETGEETAGERTGPQRLRGWKRMKMKRRVRGRKKKRTGVTGDETATLHAPAAVAANQ